MKLSRKKILRWSFWPILAIFVFGIYFLIPKEEKQEHLNLIPSNSEFVVLANPISLFKTYSKLLKENPQAFGDIQMDIEDGEMRMGGSLGLNPAKKIAIFDFNEPSVSFTGIALLAETNDFLAFVEMLNKRDNKEAPSKFMDGEYLLSPKDNEFYLFKDGVGVMVKSEFYDINKEIAELCFKSVFESEKHLIDEEPTFMNQIESSDQLTYWSKKGHNLIESLNPQIGVLSNLFDRKRMSVNVTEKGFETRLFLELIEESSIVNREAPEELKLIGDECFRFTASVSPDKFKSFFEVILPKGKEYLLTSWNGGVAGSINGFDDVSVKKIAKKDSIIIQGIDTLYPFKMVEEDLINIKIPFAKGGIDELFSYPYITVSCELSNVNEVKEMISSDSTISNVGAYYSFVLPNYILIKDKIKQKQRVYFYFVDNSIVFCPELPKVDFVPQYNNFGMLFRFDPFFANYTTKGAADMYVMSVIEDFGFNGFALNYEKSENGFVELSGIFDLKDTDNHLIGFPLLLKKILDNPLFMTLPGAF